MKHITILLMLIMLIFSACEPLQTPPPEITPQVTESESAQNQPPEPYPLQSEPPAGEPELPSETQVRVPTNPPVPDLPMDVTPGEMVEIAGGTFLMGCAPDNNAGSICPGPETPAHEVTLPSYFIDRYEVTNGQYKQCVDAGACRAPLTKASRTRTDYYGNPDFDAYPVVNVSFADAKTYCEWADLRLPTEAEWEFAARSSEANLYPWGSHEPDCTLANSVNNLNAMPCVGDTTMVGSYPEGASAFGVMDMAGNVWEWVADYYSPEYYSVSPTEAPFGPVSGSERVVRGGGWSNNWVFLRSSARAYDLPFFSGFDLGFRCAADMD